MPNLDPIKVIKDMAAGYAARNMALPSLLRDLIAAADAIEEERSTHQHVIESRESAYKEIMRLEARLRDVYEHPDASQGIRSIIKTAIGL